MSFPIECQQGKHEWGHFGIGGSSNFCNICGASKVPEQKMNPWQPMDKAIDLKHMGKLNEELGELVQVISRCMIQGIDETDPTRTETNRQWLEKEIADVYANLALVCEHFKLTLLVTRMETKKANLRDWHAMLTED